MRRILIASVVVVLALGAYVRWAVAPPPAAGPAVERGSSSVEKAFANHSTGVEVCGSGTVIAILRDDDEGSRHQRLVLRIDSGTTVLISHNIDIAPRVSPLRTGDRIAFCGEYVWNPKGGLIHWTHHDPTGQRSGGWLKHDGETFR